MLAETLEAIGGLSSPPFNASIMSLGYPGWRHQGPSRPFMGHQGAAPLRFPIATVLHCIIHSEPEASWLALGRFTGPSILRDLPICDEPHAGNATCSGVPGGPQV